MMGLTSFPHWLDALLREKFFDPCLLHETGRKNEKNTFCLDCCFSICPQCISCHQSHRLLQVRRYVYHDVIRIDALEKLIDCSFVQSYTTNSAKVVFLHQRPQSKPFRGSSNICSTCHRHLQDPYLFCSVACKVKRFVRSENRQTKYLFQCHFLPLHEGLKGDSCCYELDDGQMTPDSILHSPTLFRTTLGSDWSASSVPWRKMLACTATTEFARKKRSVSGLRTAFRARCSPATEMTVYLKRRKSVPHRSPLF